jgi:hypothetical protein
MKGFSGAPKKRKLPNKEAQLRGRVLNMPQQVSYGAMKPKRALDITNITNLYSSSKLTKNEVKSFNVVFNNTSNTYGLPVMASVTGTNPLLTANSTGGMTVLNSVQQGTQIDQRVGNKIQVKSIRLKFNANLGGTSPTQIAYRVVILYDKSTNGAYPTIASIFNDTGLVDGSVATSSTLLNASINMNNKDRFLILRDEVFTLDKDNNNINIHDFYIKRKLDTVYLSSSNPPTVGDISGGGIYLIMAANSYGAENKMIPTQLSARIRYYD